MKACIVTVSRSVFADRGRWASCLPDRVEIAETRASFDRDGYDLQLRGDGLPDWCKTQEGCFYPRAGLRWMPDGKLDVCPV